MSQYGLPLYYYPTSIAVVDDSAGFIESIVMNLRKKTSIITAEDPTSFLSNDHKYMNPSLQASRTRESREISVLICDYDMPKMNGIQLMEKLRGKSVKKILITGAANEETVVDAFNNKQIDGFVRKSDPNFFEKLTKLVDAMKISAFRDASIKTINSLQEKAPYSLILKDAFHNVVSSILNQYRSEEFYFVNENGSFVFIDSEGNEMITVITDDREIQQYKRIAIENGASKEIIGHFSDDFKKLFIVFEEERALGFEQWGELFRDYSTFSLDGSEYYYLTLPVKGKSIKTFSDAI